MGVDILKNIATAKSMLFKSETRLISFGLAGSTRLEERALTWKIDDVAR